MELYNTIVHMDSVYFNAYNTCDMDKQAAIFADSIEFYHDGSGLETSKKNLLAAIKDNICGKVTRVLVKGSIEVYQIPNFGALKLVFTGSLIMLKTIMYQDPINLSSFGDTGTANGRLPA